MTFDQIIKKQTVHIQTKNQDHTNSYSNDARGLQLLLCCKYDAKGKFYNGRWI